jgi:Tol biopolymer transport system component
VRVVGLIALVAIAGGASGPERGQPPPIAFTSIRDDHDLVVMRPDGSHRQVITGSGRDDRAPSWSPDGTRIAFNHFDGTTERIDLLDLHTGRIRELADGSNPDWSPNGHRLVFVSAGDLETMNANGSGRRRLGLAQYGIESDTSPSWSQDGRTIAFMGKGLYVVGADGSNPRRISAEGQGGGADWSPSGGQIAFDCQRGRFAVCRIQPDGSRLRGVTGRGVGPAWSRRNLIAVSYGDPYADFHLDLVRPTGRFVRTFREAVDGTWSPDGTRLLVAEDDETARLYSTGPAGGRLARLNDNLRAHDQAPVWSPDGRKIAFRRLGRRGCWISVLSVASRRVRPLTKAKSAACNGRADWSADGRRLLYADRGDLWVISSRGGRPRRLTSTRQAETAPRWAPDQRSIGFVSRDGIWVLDPSGHRSLLVRRGGRFAWSHDGSMLAYLVNSRLWLRDSSGAVRRLRIGVVDGPSWSPDDQEIAFTEYPPGTRNAPALIVPVPSLWTTDLAGNATEILDNVFQPDWRP